MVTGQTRLPSLQADTCIPKLNEGDQIVLINGRDISEHTHDQVVMFIKASRESHTRELALVIRRKGNGRLPAGSSPGTPPVPGGARPGPPVVLKMLCLRPTEIRNFPITTGMCDFSLEKFGDLTTDAWPLWPVLRRWHPLYAGRDPQSSQAEGAHRTLLS